MSEEIQPEETKKPCVNCGCKDPENVVEDTSAPKAFEQAVNADEDEDINFGEKLEKLLQSDASEDEDNSVLIGGQMVDTSKFTRVELPNGMFITVPKGSDKADPEHMKKLLADVPEDDATDYDPAEQDKTHTYFKSKDGAMIDLGDGPAKSDYKPGQLKHLQEKYRNSAAFKVTQERVAEGQADRTANLKAVAYTQAVEQLSLWHAIKVPFVVLWKKGVALLSKMGLYAPSV